MCAPNSFLSERERETGAGIIAVAHKYANHTVRRGQSGGGMASPLSTVRYAEDANLIEMADMEAGSHGGGVGYAATVMPIVATDATERERVKEDTMHPRTAPWTQAAQCTCPTLDMSGCTC
jgi:hypothetical protein